MSKKNGTVGQTPLPPVLATLVERAHQQLIPKHDQADQEALPLLVQLLLPLRLDDPFHKGEGRPKQVWREPLLMVSFDRSQGQWKVAVSDRLFKLTTSTCSESLSGSLVAFEKALRDKTATVRERD